jgi:hypothetical protein
MAARERLPSRRASMQLDFESLGLRFTAASVISMTGASENCYWIITKLDRRSARWCAMPR